MKRLLSYAFCLAALLAMVSCDSSKRRQALLPNISGHAGEVIVVIDRADWEGAVGTTLRDTLAQDCKFLPQREPLYSLVNVIPSVAEESHYQIFTETSFRGCLFFVL